MLPPPNWQPLFIVLLVAFCLLWGLNRDSRFDWFLASGLAHKAQL